MKKIYLILIITLFLTGCFNNLTDSGLDNAPIGII